VFVLNKLTNEVRMKKLDLSILVAALVLTVTLGANAQQAAKVPRIGYLAGGTPDDEKERVAAFQQGLRDLSYVDGKNILVEYRYADGNLDAIKGLVTELMQLKIDVLVSGNFASIRAAKEAIKTIPIVVITAQNPVETGLVESLAHPGGNITGLTTLNRELGGKRLELLKEVIPKLLRVGAIWEVAAPGAGVAFKEYDAAARALKIELQPLKVQGPNPDLEGAFKAAVTGRANALIPIRSTLMGHYRKRIADLAIKNDYRR
jgi:putative ABC transport system substrate-binding protein